MVLPNGHTCDGGNRTLPWSKLCDGIIDCYDRSDEQGHFCKLCINNLYSCPPKDDIRCDLACQMLHYVPCQTIQDRRACHILQKHSDDHSFFHLFEEFKFYIVATIVTLLGLIGIIVLIRYLQQRIINSSVKSSKLGNDPIETDTLSSHIYEQCYEPSSEKITQNYPYYEHAV